MNSSLECRIKEKLKKLLNEVTPAEEIEIDSKLVDIGVNSVTFIQFVVAMEEEYKIVFGIDDLNFHKYASVRDVCSYVESRISESTVKVEA